MFWSPWTRSWSANRAPIVGGRSIPGRLHRVLCSCGVFLLACAFQAPVRAADYQLQYTATVRERYSQDVFRAGADGESDFITSLRVEVGLTSETARSSANVRYAPRYFDHATFSNLDHLDHRLESSWRFTPGRRSVVGFRQAFEISTRRCISDHPGVTGRVT